MKIEELYDVFLRSHCVTTDSRAITPGAIFFALRGEHADGNRYALQALQDGAAIAVVDDPALASEPRCMWVEDVLKTLQDLASLHRSHLSLPIVGITGTNGKTTTKELVSAVLSRRYRTAATRGNFNNHLGVPLTLLSIPADAEVAIVEMGANHPGEIEFLCRIADPDMGLITNVGRAHLEGFGSFEGVVRTKTELYRHLAAKGGTLFVNADNDLLMEQVAALPTSPKRVTYGNKAEAMVHGSNVGNDPYLHFYFEVGDNVYNVRTHLLGAYNFDNCMAAVAVGLHLGVDPWDIKQAIEEYIPKNQRSEYKESTRGNRLYLDCYNANPSSMAAAIASFRGMHGTMAIIGGMHELGTAEHEEHRRVVEQLEACGLDRVLLVGPEWASLPHPDSMLLFPDTDSVRTWLQEHPVAEATILVKGSNTNRLWTLEELL